MNDETKINHFINCIRSYNYWILKEKNIKEELEKISYELSGLSSPAINDMPKVPQNPYSNYRRQELWFLEEEKERELVEVEKRKAEVDRVLCLVTEKTKTWFTLVYIDGMSMLEVASLLGGSIGKLRYNAEKEIVNFL